MEELEEQPSIVHRPHMPPRLDSRVYLEVFDQLCHFMTSHGVVLIPPIYTLQVEALSTTWNNFPHDMKILMRNIIGVVNLIDTLRDGAHDHTTYKLSVETSTPSTPPHDPPPPSDSPPHESDETSIDHPSSFSSSCCFSSTFV
jgi:hypothetical protein